jgi:hypothetical protein
VAGRIRSGAWLNPLLCQVESKATEAELCSFFDVILAASSGGRDGYDSSSWSDVLLAASSGSRIWAAMIQVLLDVLLAASNLKWPDVLLVALLRCSKIMTQNFKKRTPLFFFMFTYHKMSPLILPRPLKDGHIVDASFWMYFGGLRLPTEAEYR